MSRREKLTYLLLRVLSAILSRLSYRSISRLGTRLGAFAFHRLPLRKKEALSHLEKAFPDSEELFYQSTLRRVYEHFGRTFVEALTINGFNTSKLIVVEGRECLDEALAEGSGVILVSGHFGNWELIPPWLARNGYAVYPVIRRQKNQGADRFFVELRRRIGTYPLYPNVPPHDMIGVLRHGNILGLVSDQDARRSGVFVKFLGLPASTPKGPAIFHRKTGAPIVIALCRRHRDRTYRLRFDRIQGENANGDTVAIITQRIASYLEQQIRRHPEQYFWFHRRWKTKPQKT